MREYTLFVDGKRIDSIVIEDAKNYGIHDTDIPLILLMQKHTLEYLPQCRVEYTTLEGKHSGIYTGVYISRYKKTIQYERFNLRYDS